MGEKREEEEQGEGTEKGKMRRGKGEGNNQIIYLLQVHQRTKVGLMLPVCQQASLEGNSLHLETAMTGSVLQIWGGGILTQEASCLQYKITKIIDQ